MRTFLLLLLAFGAAAEPRTAVIDSIARQIESRYVLVDEAPRIAANVRANAAKYEAIADDRKFAETISNDLREVSGDIHFAVEHDPARADRLLAAGVGTKRKLPELPPSAEERERMRRTNYGFRRVEILDGNVAIIEMTAFDNLDYSRAAAAAAMAVAANADAVIFDLRSNPGGSGNTVAFLASHFVPPHTQLMKTFDRETGKTTTAQTSSVTKRPMLNVPLYVLTGPGTGSAAEAFAFVVQQLGRATVVGEHSAGAAQGGGWVPVGSGFTVFIPTFRPVFPKTGRNWERSGVVPEVAVPTGQADKAAHLHAVTALDKRQSNPDLKWLLPLLDLAANGPGKVDTTGIAGKYKGAEITADMKFIGASGVPRDLVPLSANTFLIEDASVAAKYRARVRFVRDASGNVTGLELLAPGGRVIPRPRL